jgi:hypothetical protein
MSIKSFDLAVLSATQVVCACTSDNTEIPATVLRVAPGRWPTRIKAASVGSTATATTNSRTRRPTITPTSPNPQLQFTASFAPAATPCELHPTSAHPPHSTSHHRECCPPVRLTLRIPERMVHA